YHPLGDITTQRDTMRIVLALLFVGVANSASIFTPSEHVRHGPSSAPAAQYMSVEDLFGPTVYLNQNTALVDQPVPISGPQAVIEEVAVAPVVKSAATDPYLLNGPVVEYTVPFGVDIPGINFDATWLSQHASVPVETDPVHEVVSYSSATSTGPAPAVVTYAAQTVPSVPAPAIKFDSNPFHSITNMLQTFYKQDDGMLETVAPTHVSYSAPVPPALASAKASEPAPTVWWTPAAVVKKVPVPAKEPETAPTVWWTPAAVVKKAPVSAKKPETAPTVWWTPAAVVKADTVPEYWTPAPVAKKDHVTKAEQDPAPAVQWWTPAVAVKKIEEESVPTEEEEGDESSPAESKSTDEAENNEEGSEGEQGYERAEKAEEEEEEEEDSDEKR
ncbi:unnamed protein product, partial [Meganyctiphanes norvegica]